MTNKCQLRLLNYRIGNYKICMVFNIFSTKRKNNMTKCMAFRLNSVNTKLSKYNGFTYVLKHFKTVILKSVRAIDYNYLN
jgi:hypothetical protein